MVYNELVRIVGEGNVTKSMNAKLVYSTDASTERGEPVVIVWPSSINEVQKIIELANKKFLDVVVRGGGTGLVGGAVPKKSLVINMSRMNKVIEADDKSVFVEAGIVLDELNYELFNNKKFFPVIPASHAVCTIGGMIACNAAGKRAVHYGKTCSLVEYLEVVDGNARLRRVYDVKKFCGSEGTLGVIVKAKLRIVKLPGKLTLDVYKFDNTAELINTLVKLRSKKTHLLSLEVLDKLTSSFLGLEDRYHLIVEYDNNSGSIRNEEEIKEWDELRDKAYAVIAGKGFIRIQDPQFKEAESLKIFIEYLEDECIPFFGHISIGVLHPCVSDGFNLKKFYEKVLSLGGSVSGEHGIGLSKKEYVSEEFKHALEFHKKSLDRNNIMNRSKVL